MLGHVRAKGTAMSTSNVLAAVSLMYIHINVEQSPASNLYPNKTRLLKGLQQGILAVRQWGHSGGGMFNFKGRG